MYFIKADKYKIYLYERFLLPFVYSVTLVRWQFLKTFRNILSAPSSKFTQPKDKSNLHILLFSTSICFETYQQIRYQNEYDSLHHVKPYNIACLFISKPKLHFLSLSCSSTPSACDLPGFTELKFGLQNKLMFESTL